MITREEALTDARTMDTDSLPPVHPGEVLREEYLAPLSMSVYRLAAELHLPRTRLNDIVLGRRSITPDTAMRLGRYFGTSAEFWLNLQVQHDLELCRLDHHAQIKAEITPLSA